MERDAEREEISGPAPEPEQGGKSGEGKLEVHVTCRHSDKYDYCCGDCVRSLLASEREKIARNLPEERIIHGYMETQGDGKTTEYCNGWNDYRLAALEAIRETP